MRRINGAGLALLKSFEGCKLTSYQDQGGVWTIGFGHTGPEVVEGMIFTPEQATMQLEKDLEKFYHLDQYLTENVNDNQYSALICLAYNIGLRALKYSQVLRKVNCEESPDSEWRGWSHVNGVENKGLLRRREAELKLFHTI